MNTDPLQIRAEFDAALAELPRLESGAIGTDPDAPGVDAIDAASAGVDAIDAASAGVDAIDAASAGVEAIDAVGRRLEQAHQILVNALESVEKG